MEWFLVAVLAILLFGTSLACLVLLLARNRVQRHHRVDPAIPTDAPLTWLADPRTPARLHRRLARVGTSVTSVIEDHQPRSRRRRRRETPSVLASTALDLRAQAVALDLQVSRIAMLASGARRGPMVDIARQVTEIEVAAARLLALSTQARAPRGLEGDDAGLAEVTQRVDRLAHAHHELLALDADAGLAETPLPAPPLTGAPSPRQGSPSTAPASRSTGGDHR